MQTIKTPVQVTQELLALVTARQELIDKTRTADLTKNDTLARALQDELSLYGDGVSATVDHSDPYFDAADAFRQSEDTNFESLDQKFRQAVSRLNEQAAELPKDLEKIINELLA